MQDGEFKVNNDNLSEKDDSTAKVYELGYLLVPKIAEEDIAINYGNIKELV